MPSDEGPAGREADDPDAGDVETWPPEAEGQTREGPPPDYEQARQGPRDPPPGSAHEPGRAAPRGPMTDAEARNWAAGAHLASLVGLLDVPSILGPLVVWLVKREDHPFVADQARESLNFQISVFIYGIVGAIAAAIFAIATLGMGLFVVIPLAVVFVVGVLLISIYAAIQASEGTRYRYPLTLRLVSASEDRSPANA